MKLTVKTLLLTTALLSANVALADSTKKITLSESLMANVLTRDVAQAQNATQNLKKILEETTDESRSEVVDKAFAELINAWKLVQTAYIAGELDGDMIDTPRLVDAYHDGKENLPEQLARVLKSGDEPKTALFKNTFKSITALAFYLYEDKTLTKTEIDYAKYTLDTLAKHLVAIAETYKKYEEDFYKDNDMSMSYVLNALIDSSYKLKEWRVGDPAGLSRKYKGEPDNRRQEYPYSELSLKAIEAILSVHADMMAERDYFNLGAAAIEQGATDQVALVRKFIAEAQQQVSALAARKVDFAAPEMQALYKTLGELNDAYYLSLVQALPVQAKILDADGD